MSKKEKKVVGDVKKFTVVRKNWYRGKGSDKSCLANNANRLCCLGFYAEACGLDRQTIRNLPSPEEAVRVTRKEPVNTIHDKRITRQSNVIWDTKLVDEYKGNINTNFCAKLMELNDDKELEEKDRETQLKENFSLIGVKVIFK